MTTIIHLKIAGVILLGLVWLNFLLPRKLNWKEELPRLSLLNRQIFLVHVLFIVLTVTMFGVLALFFTSALLQPSPLSRLVLAGLALFWAVRLVVQLFIYDSRLWRGDRGRTILHVVFSTTWAYLTFAFAFALWNQF
jgi:hypothetical protein